MPYSGSRPTVGIRKTELISDYFLMPRVRLVLQAFARKSNDSVQDADLLLLTLLMS